MAGNGWAKGTCGTYQRSHEAVPPVLAGIAPALVAGVVRVVVLVVFLSELVPDDLQALGVFHRDPDHCGDLTDHAVHHRGGVMREPRQRIRAPRRLPPACALLRGHARAPQLGHRRLDDVRDLGLLEHAVERYDDRVGVVVVRAKRLGVSGV